MAVLGKAIRRLRGRRSAVSLLLIAWLVVVVGGAGAEPGSDNWVGIPTLSWLSVVLVIIAAIGAIIVIASVVMAMRRPAEGGADRKISIRSILLLVLLVWLLSGRVPSDDESQADPDQAPASEPADDESSSSSPRVALDRDELAMLLGILCVAGAVVLVSRRRLDVEPEPPDLSVERTLGSAIDEARATLLLGDDPRSAVLRAYQGLEEAMEGHGVQRGRTETPTEHLARVLADLPIDPDPVLRLGELYRMARFSDHPVTAADRRSAAACLAEVSNQLAASA